MFGRCVFSRMYLLNSVSRIPNAPKTPRCSDSNDVNVLQNKAN